MTHEIGIYKFTPLSSLLLHTKQTSASYILLISMKNLISFITLLIFLHTTTYHMISTEAKNGLPDPVLDTDGDELLAGGTNDYFIRPVSPGMGGGLMPVHAEGFCVGAVAQLKSDTDLGRALIFLPDGYKEGDVVRESTDMNIAFFIINGCVPSGYWKVGDYNDYVKQYFVMLGGVEGHPGNETVSNWFKIEKSPYGDYDYKIVYCPSVCGLCTVACGDVGIYHYNGVRRLVLSDAPFYVKFQKAKYGHKKY